MFANTGNYQKDLLIITIMKTAGHRNYYKTEQCSEGALDCFHFAIHRRNPLATTSWSYIHSVT